MPYTLAQPTREKLPPYVVFKDFFSEDECEKIIQLSVSIPPQPAQIGVTEGKVDLKKRISTLHWINWEAQYEWIFSKLAAAVANGNNLWWGFHLSGLNEALQLTHYKAKKGKNGHYDWHEDWGDQGAFQHRKISGIVVLNDKFEGGEFQFLNDTPKETSKGTLILFPSFKTHRVAPVTKGERWSLVFWVTGPPFC